MNDTSSPQENPRIRKGREFDDPHYHDEEDDISAEERRRRAGHVMPQRPQAARCPSPRRRYEE